MRWWVKSEGQITVLKKTVCFLLLFFSHCECVKKKNCFFSLNFANAESQRPFGLPRCPCIIIVNVHWRCAPDVWLMSLTYFLFYCDGINKNHIFFIITWISLLQFSWRWVLWMDCRWGHIFLIYNLSLNVEGQGHLAVRKNKAIIGPTLCSDYGSNV